MYTDLRNSTPVPWSNAYGGFWAVTTYDDVIRVTSDSDTFVTSVQNVVPAVPRTTRRPPLHFDPPDHARYRAPLDRVLRKSLVQRLEGNFRSVAEDLTKYFITSGGGDYSTDVALPFAAGAFACLLDVPADRVMEIRKIGVDYSLAIQAMDTAQIATTSAELYELATAIVDLRRRDPRSPEQDLVSSLLAAGDDPDAPISDEMVVASVRQLIVAGIGAPQAVLGSIVAHLSRDHNLQDRLRADRTLLPRAIEEFLRLYAPYRVFARTPVEDVVVGGRTIAAGEPIAMIFPSANRDAARFPNAQEFVLDRAPNPHLAFGRGPHRCPAAAMARLELGCALDTLLSATTCFALDGEIEMFNWLEFGPRVLPLTITPRATG
ncbi:cytochrome P450 [Rhodococcus wratislaviensis]|uniref:cytochrome P450 n=1 Tax=Rhodococcus wratislaviensis TaxID=44752 RepID=UPI003510D64E